MLAPYLFIAICGFALVIAFCRVGGDAQSRDDAAHKRANADRAPVPEILPLHSEGNSL